MPGSSARVRHARPPWPPLPNAAPRSVFLSMSPMRNASSVPIGSAENSSSTALARPTMLAAPRSPRARHRRCGADGEARALAGNPDVARQRQPQPPVMQKPSMAAITGFDSASSEPFSRCRLRKKVKPSAALTSSASVRSAPAEKFGAPGHDQRADGRIGLGLLRGSHDLADHLQAHGVAPLRPVDYPPRRPFPAHQDRRVALVSSLRAGLRTGPRPPVDALHPSAYFSPIEIKFRTAG